MPVQQLLQSIADKVRSSASVKSVYGDPVEMEGKTIIPVARVVYGFGGGGGSKPAHNAEEQPQEGGGGGGGVAATPVGVIEITPEGTRFVPIAMGRKMVAAVAMGALVGMLISRRLCGKRQ
jgi:uncharacterized spore protein YtfJ